MTEIVLTLVIGCLGEIGYQRDARECHLMWEQRAEVAGWEPEATAREVRRYNSVWKRYRGRWLVRTPHARAARSITLDCERPAALRPGLLWDRRMRGRGYSRRESCEAAVEAAWDFLDHPGVRLCPGADHYGGAMDIPPPCAVRVDCGETKQRYWSFAGCGGKTLPASVAAGH